MKILFSPSEAKKRGGEAKTIKSDSFIFPELFEKRFEIVKYYNDFINKASNKELIKLFGTKKQEVVDYYKGDLFSKEVMKIVQRYNGVAFDYLSYDKLDNKSQSYIDQNVMIFSNLFGPILAGDIGIPDYKLKQGKKINGLALEKFYNEYFTDAINKYLENEDIIDLRAGFYKKFYKINKPYTTMKFIKNGKVVSHWAKAYRGIVLRELAINNVETMADFKD